MRVQQSGRKMRLGFNRVDKDRIDLGDDEKIRDAVHLMGNGREMI